MPLPQDDTLPKDNQVSNSHTEAPVKDLSSAEVSERIQQLEKEAAVQDEEAEEEDEDDNEETVDGVVGAGGESGAGGEGSKKKKKKKKGKGKASKAVAALKCVLYHVHYTALMTER